MKKILFEKFACDVCGSNSTKSIDVVKYYNKKETIEVCNICGFVFCQNRRPFKIMKKDWKEKVFKNKFDTSTYDSINPAVFARLTYALEFLKTKIIFKNKSICDIGAGKGEFIEFLRQADLQLKEIYGVELSEENSEILKNKSINHFTGGIEEYRKSKIFRKFDILTLNWTLENTQSAKDCLNICYDMLNDDGVIFIATGSRILVPFKKPLQNYIPEETNLDIHPFHFSANSIKALLNNAGFKSMIYNRYIDTDYLCVIARKKGRKPKKIKYCDNPGEIKKFFSRWHKESLYYR